MEEIIVSAEDALYRRAFGPPDKKFLNPDGSATSRVFKLRPKDNGQLSVDVKRLTTPENAVMDPARFILFELDVKEVNGLGLRAIHDPLTKENHNIENPAHACILGLDEDDDILPGLLARKSTRVFTAWQGY